MSVKRIFLLFNFQSFTSRTAIIHQGWNKLTARTHLNTYMVTTHTSYSCPLDFKHHTASTLLILEYTFFFFRNMKYYTTKLYNSMSRCDRGCSELQEAVTLYCTFPPIFPILQLRK